MACSNVTSNTRNKQAVHNTTKTCARAEGFRGIDKTHPTVALSLIGCDIQSAKGRKVRCVFGLFGVRRSAEGGTKWRNPEPYKKI